MIKFRQEIAAFFQASQSVFSSRRYSILLKKLVCRFYHNRSTVGPYHAVGQLSVIIPALNEAAHIGGCIRSLKRHPEIGEIIVADGGSKDSTASVAIALGVHVVPCRRKGRGGQVCEGIACASGDVILVFHADCRLKEGAAGRMLAALNSDPFVAGGAFQMGFATRKRGLGGIAALNNLRARLTGISFGDQGQFARLEALGRIGGFPEQMLMEDVELSLQLNRVGHTILLADGIEVSARRWKGGGLIVRVAQIVCLFAGYLLTRRNRRCNRYGQRYYRRYYGE